jgi:hypothetical protein
LKGLHYRQFPIDVLLGQLNGKEEQLVKWIDLGMAVESINTSWSMQVKATTVKQSLFPSWLWRVGIHITAVVIRRRARKLMEGSRNRNDVLRDKVLESFIILLIRPFA